MGKFSFYIDPGDQAKMERIFNDLAAFDTNKDVKKAYQKAGNVIKNKGMTNWDSKSFRCPSRVKHRKLDFFEWGHFDFINAGRTLSARFSSKVNSMTESVGFTQKRYNGIGKLAHIFDRGTAKRYTKKGYYRGYIFKRKGVKQGINAWTETVETEGPKVTKTIIIPELNRILTTITLK